ncbi:sulfatase [Amaricoccus sp.]|uniref:sulfatase n=1 Tax=Amaricoccus sp. TaxID=1872485 RepID=UPI001B61A4A7|nr:sulfatase [Amaricoccus sp.]MBP7241180.1 sulfatase [Amaricoccus sp.]
MRGRSLIAALAGAGALYLALAMPNHPGAATWGALAVVPLELPALVLAFALARGAGARILRAAAAGTLTAMVVVKAADLAAHLAFGRASNLAFDRPLVVAGVRLARGALGLPATVALVAGVVLVAAAVAAGLWRATGPLARLEVPQRLRLPAAAAAAVALALVAADALRPFDPPGAAFTTRLAKEHVADALQARRDLAEFRAAAATDPAAATPGTALGALAGRDVFVIFVESYGRVALEMPEAAAAVPPALRETADMLAARGLAARSGYVASPIVGGQSWLAHATALSGLTVDSEARYRALTSSPRRTLLHLAAAAGWRTVGVMPAITLAWPEGAWFGYDRVLASADLGYGGAAFGWMAMPDQFTLAALERAELDRPGRPPVLAEVALVSSHAPWTPLPRLVPWETLGDGAVFAAQAAEGPAPEEIWRDRDRLRAQYAAAIAYSLRAVTGFVERRAATGPLVVVLGDHQPAPVVTGVGAGRDVPVHVIGPPDLVDRLAGWGWAAGMTPDPGAPPMAMADLRDRLLASFTGPAPTLVSNR